MELDYRFSLVKCIAMLYLRTTLIHGEKEIFGRKQNQFLANNIAIYLGTYYLLFFWGKIHILWQASSFLK